MGAGGAVASAIGGLPLGAISGGLKGPRARLATARSTGTHEEQDHDLDPNTEVHSDNEIFGDEEEDDDGELMTAQVDAVMASDGLGASSERDNGQQQQHIMIEQHHVSGAGLKQLGSANPIDRRRTDDGSSIRSADRSIYSGESDWDSNDDHHHHHHHGKEDETNQVSNSHNNHRHNHQHHRNHHRNHAHKQ
jgi:hypothetical protein